MRESGGDPGPRRSISDKLYLQFTEKSETARRHPDLAKPTHRPAEASRRVTADHTAPRPHILIVITMADIGGAQVHVRQILAGLGGEFRFTLVTGAEDYLSREARALGVEVILLDELVRPIRPLADLRAVGALKRLIRQRRPGLVHAHSFKAGLVARIAARLEGVPSLFTAHGWAFTTGAPLAQRIIGLALESVICRLCAGVIVVSRHDEALARRWRVGRDDRRHLVSNAADPVIQSSRPNPVNPQLITVGRLTPVKNQVMLLRVMRRLADNVRLFIVGEGVERQRLEAAISELRLEDRVILAGEVIDTGVHLAASTVFVLSSDFEGLPVSILEAMSAALPVVATAVGGVPEAVVDGETGFVVPRRDEVAFAARVQELLEHPDRALAMGSAGKRRYTAQYTPERFLTDMRRVYLGILGG